MSIRHHLAPLKAALMIGDGLMAFVMFMVLTDFRMNVLAGTWSVSGVQPVEVAIPYGVLWIAALWIAGVYRRPTRRTLGDEAIRVVGATALSLVVSSVLLFALGLTSISRLLLVMMFVALPAVRIGLRATLPSLSRFKAAIVAHRMAKRAAPAAATLPITIIEPPKGWPGLALPELWRLRRICLVLTRRNLMVRYRQTVVGAGWSLIQPILLMVVFTVFFGLLGRAQTEGLPFPVFYILGLVPYQMVAKIISEGTTSVVNNSALVTRVYFPRAYFPTSVALASLIDFSLALIPMALLLLVFSRLPGPNVVFTPLLVAVGWASGLGLTYLLSAVNVAYRDVAQLLPFLTQLLMFVSPVIYPSSIIPEPYRTLYFLNPIALVVDGFRWSLAYAPAPPIYAWFLGPLIAATLLIVGYVFFKKREPLFADYV